jgi:alanine racemase
VKPPGPGTGPNGTAAMTPTLKTPPSPTASVTGGALLTVDLHAIAANYRRFAALAPRAEISAVVKADGYGLGAIPIARALAKAGCETFFVAHPEEGAALRPGLGGAAKIFVLHGFEAAAARLFRDFELIPVLNSIGQVRAFQDSGLAGPCAVHFDTGMSRLGLEAQHAATLSDLSWDQNGLDIALVMSHLACGDEPGHPKNAQQLAEFRNIRARFAGITGSLSASGGAFLGPDYHFDLIRPGIGLFGGAPQTGVKSPMEAAVSLTAPILQVRQIDSGASAGYGATYSAATPRRLATVGLGYADGLLRSGSNRGAAFVGGAKCAFAGRVSMDLVTLDVSACPPGSAEPGQPAMFLGPQLTIDDAAAAAQTVAYEVLTRLGPRIARRYSGA